MEHQNSFRFIRDQYTAKRGDPAMLELFCNRCRTFIMFYQKDGPGPLLRCYWDRIHSPEHLVNLEEKMSNLEELRCSGCKLLVGIKDLYEKEQRFIFTLVEDAIKFEIKNS